MADAWEDKLNARRLKVLRKHAPEMWEAIAEHWTRGGHMFLNGKMFDLAPRIQADLDALSHAKGGK